MTKILIKGRWNLNNPAVHPLSPRVGIVPQELILFGGAVSTETLKLLPEFYLNATSRGGGQLLDRLSIYREYSFTGVGICRVQAALTAPTSYRFYFPGLRVQGDAPSEQLTPDLQMSRSRLVTSREGNPPERAYTFT
ncbi:hypothetical protein GEV33_002981 [Tenebrio molitor]|uniref:Uncharacterized protein n=1 Tax=Tenebrio molitor TaxID=7067 RepID=A0A8J6HS82_TENMO|nr:hypothetical protein GEV33_002981 [Tenebrio molitor]